MKLYNIKSLQTPTKKILIDQQNNLYYYDQTGYHFLLNQNVLTKATIIANKYNIDLTKYYTKTQTTKLLQQKIFKPDVIMIIKNLLFKLKEYTYKKVLVNNQAYNKITTAKCRETLIYFWSMIMYTKQQINSTNALYLDKARLEQDLNTITYSKNQFNNITSEYLSDTEIEYFNNIVKLMLVYTKSLVDTLNIQLATTDDIISALQLVSYNKEQADELFSHKASKQDLIAIAQRINVSGTITNKSIQNLITIIIMKLSMLKSEFDEALKNTITQQQAKQLYQTLIDQRSVINEKFTQFLTQNQVKTLFANLQPYYSYSKKQGFAAITRQNSCIRKTQLKDYIKQKSFTKSQYYETINDDIDLMSYVDQTIQTNL